MSEQFRMEEAREDGTVVLVLRGELDLASVDEVQQRLDALSGSGEPTRLDLDHLAFMDSSGLRVVLLAAEASRVGSWQFTLTAGSKQVRHLFASAGVAGRLPIVPARD